MPQLVDCTLHYLVIDYQSDRPIHVFLNQHPGRDADNGPRAEPVVLDLLPNRVRHGHAGRPYLGRSPLAPTLYREFRSEDELAQAQFVPIPHYRVCDTWDDYHFPWRTVAAEQATEHGCDDSL